MTTTSIVKYTTDSGEITLSPEIIKDYLVSGDSSNVSDQEVMMFMQLCKGQGLNPFLREAYLVKFRGAPASMIVGKDVFTKRARKNPNFRGFKAGIIVLNVKGEMEERTGTLYIKGKEELIGGFAEIYIAGWDFPLKHTASMDEFQKGQATWKSMPGTMIRKVALVQALREAFPEDFQGLYDSSEMGVNSNGLSEDVIVVEPDHITPRMAKELTNLAKDKSIITRVMDSKGYTRMGEIKLAEYEELKEMVVAMNNAFELKDEKLPFEPDDAEVIEEE